MDPALLLLVPTRSYRTGDFASAAARMGVPVLLGSDLCHRVEETFGGVSGQVSLDYRHPERAAERIAEVARERPVGGVVPTDEGTAVIAALAAERLGLAHNPPDATRRAGNKHLQREALRAAGLPVPPFSLHPLGDGPERAAAAVPYPCVLKPLVLSASRGVIRADGPAAFVAAWRRIEAILHEARAERRPSDAEGRGSLLVEGFVPGAEVALEGLLRGGRLEVLALFDKPDPLDGPFFEETLYVTPSRHPGPLQERAAELVAASARALGLAEGPLHAELRLGPSGPVVLEVAARSIGGLCGRTLRFGAGVSLEEVVIAHAMGRPLAPLARERRAAGVMMLPIPQAGVLRELRGLDRARAVAGVEDVVVTIPEGREVRPLPEGDAYLGFAFARGERPEDVEASLREAHRRLEVEIRPALPVA
ncbi:MAG TPA: ATP-grasp domain-containing protein [Anaeromyxobacteraceae bacterium]|nr:ATP-grasp domain-containing protein [Anaeromyxobacteraceae bacterium]